MTPMRVLALSPVPEEGASARFRLYQYIPALRDAGIELTISPFFTPEFFRVVYDRRAYGRKARLFARRSLSRLRLLARTTDFDAVLVHREAFPVGPPLLELGLARWLGRPLVYDFDDSIFLPNTSAANRLIGILKFPQKVARIIRASARVIAGNTYLAGYAREYNPAVTVIPTAVDTARFVPGPRSDEPAGRRPVVGWIGSHSTGKYLRSLTPALEAVAARHGFELRVVGSAERFEVRGAEVRSSPWTLAREVGDFAGCDVGVYPLWDDPWTRGKCGFKAIQFMACGVPVVAAAVGVNNEIVEDGVNGFLAANTREWVDKLGYLLSDARLREKLGQAGRQTVEERYSLAVNAPLLVDVLREVGSRARADAARHP